MLQYSIRAAISAISLSQWAALHLFPSVAHILFTCWCDESICFVTLSGVLCLGAVYWSALWEVADAAVETFLFFFLFTGKKKKKKREIHVFLIHTNVRKQKSKHESPLLWRVLLSAMLTAAFLLICTQGQNERNSWANWRYEMGKNGKAVSRSGLL